MLDIEKALEDFDGDILKKLKRMVESCNGKYKGEHDECLLSRTKVNTETIKYINNIMKIRTEILGCPFMKYMTLFHEALDYYAHCEKEGDKR